MSESTFHFDFALDFPAMVVGETFNVLLKYDLKGYSEEDFRIRVSTNTFCIVDEFGICLQNHGTWDFMPTLREKLDLMVIGNFSSSIPLCFEIQNISTGEVYKTPEKLIWRKGHYANYPGNLNQRVLSSPPTLLLVKDAPVSSSSQENGTNLPHFVPFLLVALLIFGWIFLKMIKLHNEKP